jgi:hypothetical protein
MTIFKVNEMYFDFGEEKEGRGDILLGSSLSILLNYNITQ